MTEKTAEKAHDVIMTSRKKLSMTGIGDVRSYTETRIVLVTALGGLVVCGTDMRLERLDVAGGVAEISGSVRSLEYTEGGAEKGFFKRLLR